ncbi:hypothetical protein BGX27_004317 [Mortierella sp. AM989]|nr:hypothetical protein BGX27_004317 [Mortierella sp. AM989]
MSSVPKPKPKLSYKAQSFPSSDKPFECTACQLYFRRLHDLKRHERLHTGERPYCCNNCRRTFARLDALKRHLSAESNVHCSDWTYQPGLASGLNRPAMRSHQRSLSLPYVQGADTRISPLDPFNHAERTSTTPSPKEHASFHHHYQHRQPQSSPESHISEHAEDDESRKQDEALYPSRSSTDLEHHCHQDRVYWGAQSRTSPPRLNTDRPLMSDIMINEDVSRSCTGLADPMQLIPSPQSYPQTYSHHQPVPHSYSHPEPHSQPFSTFNRDQLQQRRESYPSSSRSSPSPSPSPVLSPSPSSMSASSMSSPTNMWSYSKAPEAFDSTAPRRGAGVHQSENWKLRSESFSFPQRPARQELPPFNEEGFAYDRRHSREFERRPGPSLASILNSPLPSNSYPAIDQTPPPVTLSRPLHPHHSHSHSYSHPQQHNPSHHHSHHNQEGEHRCEAMVEIQKLRQELQWVTMQYRTLSEKTHTESSNSSNSGSNGGDKLAMQA